MNKKFDLVKFHPVFPATLTFPLYTGAKNCAPPVAVDLVIDTFLTVTAPLVFDIVKGEVVLEDSIDIRLPVVPFRSTVLNLHTVLCAKLTVAG
jgi:hypothetical protein